MKYFRLDVRAYIPGNDGNGQQEENKRKYGFSILVTDSMKIQKNVLKCAKISWREISKKCFKLKGKQPGRFWKWNPLSLLVLEIL